MAPTAIFAVLAVALVAGVSAKAPQKIVRGSLAAPGEFPYQASLRVNGQHVCGGAIVSKRHIVTAAHCVAFLTQPLVVATGSTSSTGGQEHTPIQILYNKQYQRGDPRSPYDIAVVTLGADIPFNANQNKIALPTAPAPAGALATVTGWGYLSAAQPQIVASLRKVQLQTISGLECQAMFGPTGIIWTNQVCTYSGPGVGTCMGDSGGPLALNNELIGVVSYGLPCAIGVPDIFTSVYDHLPWLNSIINV